MVLLNFDDCNDNDDDNDVCRMFVLIACYLGAAHSLDDNNALSQGQDASMMMLITVVIKCWETMGWFRKRYLTADFVRQELQENTIFGQFDDCGCG